MSLSLFGIRVLLAVFSRAIFFLSVFCFTALPAQGSLVERGSSAESLLGHRWPDRCDRCIDDRVSVELLIVELPLAPLLVSLVSQAGGARRESPSGLLLRSDEVPEQPAPPMKSRDGGSAEVPLRQRNVKKSSVLGRLLQGSSVDGGPTGSLTSLIVGIIFTGVGIGLLGFEPCANFRCA
uniref:Uncharacterized protein n=1 Tax=Ixodes ricinus TaxID=34613 RepID=A0A6B0UZ13_IXORI